MTNERLDEAIDRVARAMTTVPPDAAFSVRLTERLSARTSHLPRWTVTVPAAAVILVVTLLLVRPDYDAPASIAREAQAADVAAVTSRSPVASAAPAAPMASAGTTRSASSERLGHSRPTNSPRPAEPPEAEDAVVRLNVAALTVEPLTLADVEVSPLDVASLEIADIERGVEPKEPK